MSSRMRRRLLIVHPTRLDGENRGLYEQHVASMQALFADAAGWDVHALDVTHPSFADAALAAELVIVHMLVAAEVEALMLLRRARGRATIFELADNFLGVGVWLPARHALRNPLLRQRIAYHASLADAVQVYAPALVDLARFLNPRVLQLDPYVALQAGTPDDDGFVFGWGGTTSHEEDLAAIAPVIIGFCGRHPDATFAFIGNAAMRERLFGAIPPRQLRARDFGSHDEYVRFVRTWHAGLAPLRASGFNAGRSDTKLATYAACGVAAIAEDCDVYRPHAEHAILYRGNAALGEALESLYADRSRQRDLAAHAFAWASRERSIERLRAQRIAAYEPFAPHATGEPLTIVDADLAQRLAAAASEPAERRADALRAIVDEHADYAQARLALADVLRESGDDAGALAVLDARPFPPLFAGLAAERQFAIAQRVCPDRAAGYAAQIDSPVARVRLAHRGGDRQAFLHAVLEQQPFDAIALSTILRERLANGAPRDATLDALCARACIVAPEIVPPDLRPAALARFLAG